MKSAYALCIILIIITSIHASFAQKYIVRDIKTFGAKGDGRTNDHNAFQRAAAYFNNRGGNGKLIISKGTYIIGKQIFTGGKPGKPAYEGEDLLRFIKLKNFKITGTTMSILKYKDSLRFGSFSPATGMRYDPPNNLFQNSSYAAAVGNCIFFEECRNISVTNLSIDGNNKSMAVGGFFNTSGIQLPHYGIFIKNSNNVIIDNINVHHFGLDGICVSNIVSQQKDSISILNSSFQYNVRQGLSWIGGNYLVVNNCKFNNTGKESFSSAPSAGIDIEAEVGPIRNGIFTNCEFINNAGAGVVASAGDSENCIFTDCTFWGVTNWSIWVTKPAFTFKGCNIYGAIVHGYNSPDDKNATKFIRCIFEDKPYQGKEAYGNFLVETNNVKRMSFTDCKFIANKKRLYWISIDPAIKPEERYQFSNCLFVLNNADDSTGVMIGLLKGAVLKNCSFTFKNPELKKKGLSFLRFKEGDNIDYGGNKTIY